MDKAIEVGIKGLQCDACEYEDMDIDVKDYKKYIDAPCPECGESLLTEADYQLVQTLLNITGAINKVAAPPKPGEPIARFKIETDGSGIPKVGDLEWDI